MQPQIPPIADPSAPPIPVKHVEGARKANLVANITAGLFGLVLPFFFSVMGDLVGLLATVLVAAYFVFSAMRGYHRGPALCFLLGGFGGFVLRAVIAVIAVLVMINTAGDR